MNSLVLLNVTFLLFTSVVYSCCVRDYKVPEPIIERIHPKGFSVKIPHSDGISIFAFHGKINEEMEHLEAGRFSEDVCKRTGDFWIFETRRNKLDVGDKIYFWLFVIKNGLGFRYDDGEFTVKENTPYRVDSTSHQSTTIRTPTDELNTVEIVRSTTPSNEASTEPSSLICEKTILNITDSLIKLQSEVNSLKNTNEILREIAEKHPASATTLKVEGAMPINEDPFTTVEEIIKQKLGLSIEVKEAKRNKAGGITFEVANIDDKVQIIRTAKEKLRYSRIYLTY